MSKIARALRARVDRTATNRIFAVLTLAACSRTNTQAASLTRDRALVGTWRVVEFVNPRAVDSAGAFPFGRAPVGYLVYDRTGHVFFQAVHDLAADPRVRGRWNAADSASLNRLLTNAAAYFGTYSADYDRETVVHRIEAEIPPNRGTTEVATPFRINGDTLILGEDSLRHWRFVRVR